MYIDYNKKYKQILTPIRYHKNGLPFTRDSVELKCNYCNNKVKFFLLIALRKIKNDYDFKCKSCHFKSSNISLIVKEINNYCWANVCKQLDHKQTQQKILFP